MDKDLIKFVDATEVHVELIYNWRNQPFIREVMYDSEPIKWENHLNWFQNILTNEQKVVKILYYKEIPYGLANFQMTDASANVGEWGFYIGEQQAPKGMGTVLAYEMLEFLFKELNVRKVCAKVIDYNEVSLHFHKKVGFIQEGVLRKHILKNERYCDVHVFSIFKEEWLKRKIALEKIYINDESKMGRSRKEVYAT